MSISIKGIEMPTEGYIDVRIKCNGTASFAIADNPYFKAVEAIPVPPHGRLIDADALMLKIQKYIEEYGWETDEHGWHNEKWCAMKEAAMAIDAAPTILEAEEGE